MDADSGRVLYERNADRKMLIASTTKILTALVAIEEGDLHDSVKVSREAAYKMCIRDRCEEDQLRLQHERRRGEGHQGPI